MVGDTITASPCCRITVFATATAMITVFLQYEQRKSKGLIAQVCNEASGSAQQASQHSASLMGKFLT